MIPAFDWSEYLKLANDLARNSDEASHRSSISRAYYSIYHAATLRAKANGCSASSHTELWAAYQKDSDKTCRKLSTMGHVMKIAREEADYQENVADIPDRMIQQIHDARKFLDALYALPVDSPHKF